MTMKSPGREHCAAVLEKLLVDCEGVRAAMLALRDGRPFVEKSRSPIEGGKFAAMSSSLSALGQSILRELHGGSLDHVVVEGSEGKLVVTTVPGAGGLLILAVLAERSALLGLVLGRSKACARELLAER